MKIAFIVGDVEIGGGNYVVLQHAQHAAKMGHHVIIVSIRNVDASRILWHPALETINVIHISNVKSESFDVVIATFWKTVFYLDYLKSSNYVYFVQSIESRFFNQSELRMRALVDSTYALGMPGITEATWIRDYLKNKYSSNFFLVKNGINKEIYKPDGPCIKVRVSGRLRILVEGPLGVPFKNTGRTIRLCRKVGGVEIWWLTSTDISWYPGVDKVFSRVPVAKTAEIYRSCDVIVKLSFIEGMFGPPLEMFHCGGTALVYDVSGHDEYIKDQVNALVVPMHDEGAVVSALQRMRDNPELVNTLKRGAISTAKDWIDWNESSGQFLAAIEHISQLNEPNKITIKEQLDLVRQDFEEELDVIGLSRQSNGTLKPLKVVPTLLRSPWIWLLDHYRSARRKIEFWNEGRD